jgi:hypothetical protein
VSTYCSANKGLTKCQDDTNAINVLLEHQHDSKEDLKYLDSFIERVEKGKGDICRHMPYRKGIVFSFGKGRPYIGDIFAQQLKRAMNTGELLDENQKLFLLHAKIFATCNQQSCERVINSIAYHTFGYGYCYYENKRNKIPRTQHQFSEAMLDEDIYNRQLPAIQKEIERKRKALPSRNQGIGVSLVGLGCIGIYLYQKINSK